MDCTALDPSILSSPSNVAALIHGQPLDTALLEDNRSGLLALSKTLLNGEPHGHCVKQDTLHEIAEKFVALLRRNTTGETSSGRLVAIDSKTGVIITSHVDPSKEVLKVIRWVGSKRPTRYSTSSARPTLCNTASRARGAILPECFGHATFPDRLEWSDERERYELPIDGRWHWTAWASGRREPQTCFRSSDAVQKAVFDFNEEYRMRGLVANADHLTVVERRDDIGTCLVEMVFVRRRNSFGGDDNMIRSGPKAILTGGPMDSAGTMVPLEQLISEDDCLSWTLSPRLLADTSAKMWIGSQAKHGWKWTLE